MIFPASHHNLAKIIESLLQSIQSLIDWQSEKDLLWLCESNVTVIRGGAEQLEPDKDARRCYMDDLILAENIEVVRDYNLVLCGTNPLSEIVSDWLDGSGLQVIRIKDKDMILGKRRSRRRFYRSCAHKNLTGLNRQYI